MLLDLMTMGFATTEHEDREMDLAVYWHRFCAPYLRARYGNTERGASLVEYALLVALIAVICIGAVSFVGGAAKSKFSSVGSAIKS